MQGENGDKSTFMRLSHWRLITAEGAGREG